MALVTVVGNETEALLRDATINIASGATVPLTASTSRPAGISLNAFEDLSTKAYTGGGAATLFGGGVGAAANVVVLTSKVRAESTGGNISAPGDFVISATTEKNVDAQTVTVGAGLGASIGAAVAVVIAGGATAADAMAELNKDGSGTLANINAMSAAAADFVLGSDTLSAWRSRAATASVPNPTDAQVQNWARMRFVELLQGGSIANDGTYVPNPQLSTAQQAQALSDYTLLKRDRAGYVLADEQLVAYSTKALGTTDQQAFVSLVASNNSTGIMFTPKDGVLVTYRQEAKTALGMSSDPTDAQVLAYLEQRYRGFVAAIRARADADYRALVASGQIQSGRLVVADGQIGTLAPQMLATADSSLYTTLAAAKTSATTFTLANVDGIYTGAKSYRQAAAEALGVDLSGAANDAKVNEYWGARYNSLVSAIQVTADDTYRVMVGNRIAANQSFSVTNAASSASEGVYAGIGGGIVSVRDISVNAISSVSVSNMATGVGASGFGNGVGAAVAFTESNATVQAYLAGNITARMIGLNALAQDGSGGSAANTDAFAGAGGLTAGIGAAAAVSKANNNVSFSIAGTINGRGGSSTLIATAMDATTIDSRSVGATFGGGIALGASIATSIRSSTVGGTIAAASQMANWGEVAIGSGTSGAIYSQAASGAGGIGNAAAGAVATSHSSETVSASIGDGAVISAGSVSVAATARPKVLAESIGVVVAGGNAMGVSVAESKSRAIVTAFVGNDVTIIGGGLEVTASTLLPSSGDTAWARAAAGTGGFLLGANATVARAISSSQVRAYAGNRLRLPNGDVSISAVNDSRQKTEGTGIAVGWIGVGATVAETRSNGRAEAWLSDNAITSASRTGSLTVAASGTTQNEAHSVAGSGGIFAGAASVAITEDDSVSLAELRSGTSGYKLHTGGLAVESRRDYIFKGTANAFQASAIGASGAGVENDVDSEVDAKIGSGMVIHATDNVYITSTTTVEQKRGGAIAGSGGAVGAAASISETDITNDSRIDIGANTVISLDGDPTTFDGKIDIEVYNQLIGGDTVSVESGGYFAAGGASSNLDATINNIITVGANAHLFSVGALQVGTASVNTTSNRANASLYGVVTGAGANSFSRVDVTQQINLGNASTLEAFGSLTVTAGQSGNGYFASLVSTAATTEVYNYALIPITAQYRGDARSYNKASLTMGTGGKLLAGRDILVGAYEGSLAAEGKGTNHNPYLAIFNATKTDNNRDSDGDATVVLNGTVYAGINNSQVVTISEVGTVSLAARTYPYTLHEVPDAEVGNTFVSYNDRKLRYDISNAYNPYQDIVDRIASLTGLDQGTVRWRLATNNDMLYGVTISADAGRQVETFVRQIATGVPDRTVNTVEIGDIMASAGNVTIHADTLSGTATVTAKANPTIEVTNRGVGYVLLNKLLLTSNEGGHVTFTGTASGASGITVSQDTVERKPEILVRSLYPGEIDNFGNVTIPVITPDIYFLDDVSNLIGAVTVRNTIGNVTTLSSSFEAAVIDMEIPRGNLTVNLVGPGSVYDTNNAVRSQWRNTQYRPATAAQAVMAVASYVERNLRRYSGGGALGGDGEFTARTLGQAYFAGGYNGMYSQVWFKAYDAVVTYPSQTGQTGDWYKGWYKGVAYPEEDSSGPFANLRFDVIQRQALSKTAENALNPEAPRNVLVGGSIILSASTINVNGTLQSGFANSWSVILDGAASGVIDTYRNNAATRAANAGRFIELPGGSYNLDSYVRAFYDVSNDRIELQNVVQGSGGRVYLNGGIISTSTVAGENQGLIRVNGGYATVNIVNNTGTALVVNTVNTGVNTSSVVEIVDHYKLVNGTTPQRTWYVYDVSQANAVSVYERRDGGTTYRAQDLVSSSNVQTQQYTPDANLLYRWVETATAVRAKPTSIYVNTDWQWQSTLADPYSTTVSVIRGTQATNFAETITGTVVFERNNWNVSRDQGTDFNGTWYQDIATQATLTLTNTVKASNPINVQFVGGSSGLVSITSNASVQVNGTITNYNGSTAITTTTANAAILTSRDGMISGRSVTLTGQGGIGTATQAAGVQLYGGTLTASSINRDINIDVRGNLSLASVKVLGSGLGNVDLHATGDITAAAAYNLNNPIVVGRNIRIDSASGAIGARSAVNSSGQPYLADINPIVIQTRSDGVLDSSSSTGTYLVQSKGDLRVGRVRSNGTVFLAAAGSDALAANILGGTSRSGPTAEETARLQSIWNSLNLLGTATRDGTYNPDGTVNTEAFGGSAAVHGYEAMVNRAYQDYWQLRNLAYADGETYAISEIGEKVLKAQIAAKRGVTAAAVGDEEVAAEAARRFGSARFILGLSTDKSMVSLPQAQLDRLTGAPTTTALDTALDAYDEGFAYELDENSQLHAVLTTGATWTQDQLTYTIDSAANPASNTPAPTLAQIAQNIDGREVILYAPNGSIGSLAQPREFIFTSDNLGALSPEDRAAISAAGPGDLQVSTRTLAGGVTEYTIRLAEQDLVVASALGSISAKAKSAIYLGSHDDLNLGGVSAALFPTGALSGANSAGVQSTNGGVIRLEAIGDIAAGIAGATAISGNISRLTLISESGSIGRAGLPGVNPALNNNALIVEMTGGGTLDLAQAAQGIYLRQKSGDLILGNISGGSGSQAAVQLAANGSIYAQSQFTDRTVPHILGSSLDLRAGGSISFNGVNFQPLQVAITGAVTGSAGGDFTLLSPTMALTIGAGTGLYGSVSAGGRLVLDAAGGALTINRSIQAGTGLSLIASSILALADNDEDEDLPVVVKSIAGDIVASAGSIVMGTLSRIEGADLITASASGNAKLGLISSTLNVVANVTNPVIAITAGLTGSIFGNGDAVANLVTSTTGGVSLTAGSSIDLVTNTRWLTASASTGNVEIEAVAGLEARSLTATLGAVTLVAPGLLDVGTLIAGTSASVTSTGGAIKIGSLTTGTSAALDADTSIDVTELDIGTVLTSTAGTATTVGEVVAGTSMDITSAGLVDITTAETTTGFAKIVSTGGKVNLGTLKTGGHAEVDAHTDIEATDITTGTSADLDAGGAIDVETLDIGTVLTSNAGTTTTFDALTAGTSLDVSSAGLIDITTAAATTSFAKLASTAGKVNLGTLAAGTYADIDAHTDIVATEITTGTSADLNAGGAIDVETLDIGTVLTSTAGTMTTFDTVTAGTSMDVTSGGLIDITTAQATNGFAKLASTTDKVKLGTLAAGTYADIDAHTDIVATEITTGTSADLNAGGAIDVETLDIGTVLTSNAGATTAFDTVTAGTSMDMASGGVIDIATAQATNGFAKLASTAGKVKLGTLAAGTFAGIDAHTDIVATEITTGTFADLNAGGAIDVESLDIGTVLTSNAGTTTAFDTLTAGTSMDVKSSGLIDITTAEATNGFAKLKSTSGAIELGALTAGTSADIDAHTDIVATEITTGTFADLNAGGAIDVETLAVGTTLTSTAGTTTRFDTVTASTSMDVSSGGLIDIVNAQATNNFAKLASTGGAIKLGSLIAGTFAEIDAHIDIVATVITAGTFADLNAGGAIDAETLAVGTTLTSNAGTTTKFDTVAAGTSMEVSSGGLIDIVTARATSDFAKLASTGGKVKLGALTTGGVADIGARTDIEAATLTSGAAATLKAGGAILVDTAAAGTTLTSNAGATTKFSTITAGTSMDVTSGGLIEIATGRAIAGSAVVNSTGGAIELGTLRTAFDTSLRGATSVKAALVRAGGSLLVEAPSVTLDDATAGDDISITAASTIDATSLVAGDLVTLDNAGSILVGRLMARELLANGGASFNAAEIRLGARAKIAADDIRIGRLAHTGTSGPFALDVTGRNGGSAANFAAFISAPHGTAIGDYNVAQSTIDTDGSLLSIARGYVTGTFTLKTALRKIFMDNRSPRPVKGFDVQLFQPSFAFRLRQDGNATTTNAFIVQFGEGSEVFYESNGAIYAGMSMVREFDRMLGSAMASGGGASPLWPGASMSSISAVFMTEFLRQQTLESMLIREDEDEPAVNLDATVVNSTQQ